MSHIPRDPWPGRPSPEQNPVTSPEHQAFCLAREAMHRRFLEWLAVGPSIKALNAEMEMPNVLWQLRILMGVGP